MNDPIHSTFRAATLASCFLSLVSPSCGEKSEAPGAAETETEASPSQNLVTTAHPETPNQPMSGTPAPSQPAGATPTPSAPSPASEAQIAELSKPSGGPSGGMYTVKDGTKVDAKTLAGWKTWRALACDRCHGAEQQGLVGPPLVVSLHRLTKEEFKKTITDGRPEKGMPPFNASPMVMENWENLYAYLKGRADAQIQPGHLYPIDSP
jgi:mono/diheme cytochrome c family protein